MSSARACKVTAEMGGEGLPQGSLRAWVREPQQNLVEPDAAILHFVQESGCDAGHERMFVLWQKKGGPPEDGSARMRNKEISCFDELHCDLRLRIVQRQSF